MKKFIFWLAVFFVLLVVVSVDPLDAMSKYQDAETAGAYKLFASGALLIISTAAAICYVKERKPLANILWAGGALIAFPCGLATEIVFIVLAVFCNSQMEDSDLADKIIKHFKDGPYKDQS